MSFGFQLVATDGRARAGRVTTPHGVVRDAGLHAGRHPGRGQGPDAPAPRRGGRAHHPRQYLSPAPPTRRGADRPKGGPAPLHRLGRRDPDRQRRLPGLQPRRPPADHGCGRALSVAPRWQRAFLSPESAVDIQAALGSDIAMVFDECLAYPGRAAAGAPRQWSSRCAGRGAAAPACWRSAPAWTRRARRQAAAARDAGHPGPGAVRHRAGRRRS